jgi:hypothetical protein
MAIFKDEKDMEKEIDNEEELDISEKPKLKKVSSKDQKKQKDKERIKEKAKLNFFYQFVIYMIIFTFVIYGGSLLGFRKFIKDITKPKIVNEDGSISIEQDAQTLDNRGDNPDTYIGKVFGEKIRLGKQDSFNQAVGQIVSAQELNFNNKMYYIRNAYQNELNKIIVRNLAKKMGYIITKEYLSEQVGKQFYPDSEGEIDYNRMKKDIDKANERSESVYEDLLVNNFDLDFFKGIPTGYDEIWNSYKIEKTRISYDYINISNKDVDENSLRQYYDKNKDNFKQFKLTRLIFDKTKMDVAQDALNTLKKDPAKFSEIGNKLKEDNKIINIIYDSDFSFINDFENEKLKDIVKKTKINAVSDEVIEIGVGLLIFQVTDTKQGEFKDETVKSTVKTEYFKIFNKEIEKNNEKKVKDIYNFIQQNGFESARNSFNAKIESTKSSLSIMDYFPLLNIDLTDDANYIAAMFKSNINTILPPHKYANGYLIIKIKEKQKAAKNVFDNLYEQYIKQYSDQKARFLEQDFFNNEKKKYQVVDNFNYVNWQSLLMPQKENK